jgi:hypothetical protein
MNVRKPAVAMVMLGAASGASAQLWNTGPWDGRDGRASDRPTPAVRPETRAADDVLLPPGNGQPYTITGLSADLLAVHYSTAFAEIYADTGNGPGGAPVALMAQVSSQTIASGVFGLYDHVRVQFGPASAALPPGRYWVSAVMDVTGGAPADGYAFFCTAGNGTVQGQQGWDRVGSLPWQPSAVGLGFATDYAFSLSGQQNAAACYPNCDGSTGAPVLNVLDFNCFLNRFTAGDSYANCDGSTVQPRLTVLDFNCFLNAFLQGCP